MSYENYTIGVEEEYMICNPNSGELINKAYDIMNDIPNEMKNRFSFELLESEIESNTKVCNDSNEAIKEIIKYRKLLKKIGKKHNYCIGISGTHPTALAKDQKFIKNKSYNWVSEQLQYYASRNITFSLHIHIGLRSERKLVPVCNSLRRWIGPLLALSVNSPFFESNLTGMLSSRTFQFNTFPRTNIPSYINDIKEYKDIISKYLESKSITQPRQIWWKIRPHLGYRTIEFRMCDIQRSLINTKMFISLAQALVRTVLLNLDNLNNQFNYEYLQDSLWKASKYGLDCEVIDPDDNKVINMRNFIKKMLTFTSDSLKYFNNEDTKNAVYNILEKGTESSYQIKEFKKGGFIKLNQFLINNVQY